MNTKDPFEQLRNGLAVREASTAPIRRQLQAVQTKADAMISPALKAHIAKLEAQRRGAAKQADQISAEANRQLNQAKQNLGPDLTG